MATTTTVAHSAVLLSTVSGPSHITNDTVTITVNQVRAVNVVMSYVNVIAIPATSAATDRAKGRVRSRRAASCRTAFPSVTMTQGYVNRRRERFRLDLSHVAKTRIVPFEEYLDVAHLTVSVFGNQNLGIVGVLALFHLTFAVQQQDNVRVLFE